MADNKYYYNIGVNSDIITEEKPLPTNITIPTRRKLGGETQPEGEVIAIAASGFANQKELTSIKLPDNTVRIGDNAFLNCTGLTTITIPTKVTYMGTNVFSGCTALQTITVNKTEKEVQALNWPEGWNNSINVAYKPAVKYLVSVNSPYGSVTGLNNDRLYEAGDPVTFKVEVNNGYTLETVKYNDIELVANDEQYSFDMPGSNVQIIITYSKTVEPEENTNAIIVAVNASLDGIEEFSTSLINNEYYEFTIANKLANSQFPTKVYSPKQISLQKHYDGLTSSWIEETDWVEETDVEYNGSLYYLYSQIVDSDVIGETQQRFYIKK